MQLEEQQARSEREVASLKGEIKGLRESSATEKIQAERAIEVAPASRSTVSPDNCGQAARAQAAKINSTLEERTQSCHELSEALAKSQATYKQ